jgi:hypothetical protein
MPLLRGAQMLLKLATLSHTMYASKDFRKSTPPRNRQLHVLISNSKQQVGDFVGGVTFWN